MSNDKWPGGAGEITREGNSAAVDSVGSACCVQYATGIQLLCMPLKVCALCVE